jgi:hypothetical protein
MLTIPPLKKIISRSRSSKMRNTNAITNSSSSVTSIETRADRNGGGIVYHRSDCGYPRHRFYGNGGDWAGSACGEWIPEIGGVVVNRIICGVDYRLSPLFADVVWYGDYDSVRNTYNNIKNKNEDGGGKHNWTVGEVTDVVKRMKDNCSSYN